MDAMNPYAPPQAESFGAFRTGAATGYHVQGDCLVVEKGTALPDICVLTGQRTQGDRVQRKLQWAPPWLAVVVVISPLIYIIIYFIMRKTGELSFALSPEARKRRQTGILIGVGGSILAVGMMIGAIAADSVGLVPLAALGLLVAIIAGVMMANLFRVQKIDEHHIYLKLKPAALNAFGR